MPCKVFQYFFLHPLDFRAIAACHGRKLLGGGADSELREQALEVRDSLLRGD